MKKEDLTNQQGKDDIPINEMETGSEISEGYEPDKELEEQLKMDISNFEEQDQKNEDNSVSADDEAEQVDMNTYNHNTQQGNKDFFRGKFGGIRRSLGSINITGSNFVFPVLFMIITMVYLEVVLHFLIYHEFNAKIIYPILFAIPVGIVIGFITGLFGRIVNKLLLWIITGFICILFNVQLIYFYVFKVFFSFGTLGMAGEAFRDFGKEVIAAIKANIGGVILLFLPFIILVALVSRQIDYRRRKLPEQLILAGGFVVFQIIAVSSLLFFGKGPSSPYELYHTSKVPDMLGKQLGIVTLTRVDISKLVIKDEDLELADTVTLPQTATTPTKAPSNEPVVTQAPGVTLPPTPTPIDTSPNVMDIDFAALAANEKDDTLRKMDEYFAAQIPTNKNEYTGMFKGYNLIQITAEGFSPYAVNEKVTPTLYKLVNSGFVFTNFYTALWQTSTSDGEFANLLGLIPAGSRNMYAGRNNLWPFTLAHQFNLLGVQSRAYHNHTYTYYERDKTHPNLGYLYKGKGNGLELEHPDIWPESDLEMIQATVDEYVHDDQFHVYYLTVSGHMNYSFTGNMMSYKNREAVADLPYSDEVKAYIACQIELDKALEELIRRLEEAGVADRTVIALSADHYPYGWDKEKYDEIAGHKVDPVFEIYRNNFILWCEGMEENIVIDKPCSSIDILPTLSNLFGLEYDSRLLMGQDILSDAAPLVILSNRSFITDKVMYNSETGEVINLTDEPLPDGYVDNMIKIVRNKFNISKNILNQDYYRHVFSNYPEEFE